MKADEPAALPLRKVVLFNSGIGFYEHRGQVTGNAVVDMRFNVDDVNDLLKSLVPEDLDGGKVKITLKGRIRDFQDDQPVAGADGDPVGLDAPREHHHLHRGAGVGAGGSQIAHVGDLLHAHFPAPAHAPNPNELPDAIVMI